MPVVLPQITYDMNDAWNMKQGEGREIKVSDSYIVLEYDCYQSPIQVKPKKKNIDEEYHVHACGYLLVATTFSRLGWRDSMCVGRRTPRGTLAH